MKRKKSNSEFNLRCLNDYDTYKFNYVIYPVSNFCTVLYYQNKNNFYC